MRLYITDVTAPDIASLISRVSKDRIERAEKFRFEIDKRRGLAAETLLNYGLKRLCGRLLFPVRLLRNENGKPRLDLSQEEKDLLRAAGALSSEAESLCFSLSHSGDYAACAIADAGEGELGTDIEEHRPDRSGIAEHFFCRGEVERIRNDEDFYMYWTLKESFLKAVGRGLALPLDSFEVFVDASGEASYVQSVNGDVYRGRVYRPFKGYTLSVCAGGEGAVFPQEPEIVAL